MRIPECGRIAGSGPLWAEEMAQPRNSRGRVQVRGERHPLNNELEAIELVLSECRRQIRRRAGIQSPHGFSIEIVVGRFVSLSAPLMRLSSSRRSGTGGFAASDGRGLATGGGFSGSFVTTAGGVSGSGVLVMGTVGAGCDGTGAVVAGCDAAGGVGAWSCGFAVAGGLLP